MANLDRSHRVNYGLSFKDKVGIFYSDTDPSSGGSTAPIGSLILYQPSSGEGQLFKKFGSNNTDWTPLAGGIYTSASADPDAQNDGAGTDATTNRLFAAGDFWINEATPEIFVCTDNTTNTAVWKSITKPESTDVKFQGDSTTLTTLQQAIDRVWTTGAIDGFDITSEAGGVLDINSGNCTLRSTTDDYGPIGAYSVPSVTDLALTDEATNYITVEYNGGSPQIVASLIPPTTADKAVIYVVTKIGADIHTMDTRGWNINMQSINQNRILGVWGKQHVSGGTKTTEVGTRNLSVTSGKFYYGNIGINHAAFNTVSPDTFTLIHRDAAGGWTRTSSQTQIDNLYYDDNLADTGTDGFPNGLGAISNNKFANRFVYIALNNPSELKVLMGQGEFNSEAEALAEPVPGTLPPELQKYSTGVYIARVVVKQGQATFVTITNPLERPEAQGTASNHNALGGLQGGTTDEFYHLTATTHGYIDQDVTTTGSPLFSVVSTTTESRAGTNFRFGNTNNGAPNIDQYGFDGVDSAGKIRDIFTLNNNNDQIVFGPWSSNYTFAVDTVNQGTKTFTLAAGDGDQTDLFTALNDPVSGMAARTFTITDSTGNDGTYTVASSSFSTVTEIVTDEAIPDATADGNINVHTIDQIQFNAGDEVNEITVNRTQTVFNQGYKDRNYFIRKLTSGNAYAYNAGLDTHIFGGSEFTYTESLAQTLDFNISNTNGANQVIDLILSNNSYAGTLRLGTTGHLSLRNAGGNIVRVEGSATKRAINITNVALELNDQDNDLDIIIYNQASGQAYKYDAGDDTHTFNGATTFDTVPTGPATDPSSDNELPRKAYTDNVAGVVKVTQASPVLAVLDPVFNDGTSWKEAANDSEDTLATHVVVSKSGDDYVLAERGLWNVGTHGETQDTVHFLDTTSGLVTETEPTNPLHFVNELYTPVDANTIRVTSHKKPYAVPVGIKQSTIRTVDDTSSMAIENDIILADTTNGDFTFTLLNPSLASGKTATIIKINDSENTLTLGGTVNGDVNPTMRLKESSYTIYSNGTEWKIVNSHIPSQMALVIGEYQPPKDVQMEFFGNLNKIVDNNTNFSTGNSIAFTNGIGKLMLAFIAGTDSDGQFTVSGDSVSRVTGEITSGDTEVVAVSGLTTDNTTADDGNGNTKYDLVDAYLTSKWWTGSITISTTDLTMTDTDVYQLAFNQLNDIPEFILKTFDLTYYITNATADMSVHLYKLALTSGRKCTYQSIYSKVRTAYTGQANTSIRERIVLDELFQGTSDGFILDLILGGTNQYFTNMTGIIYTEAFNA